MTTKYPCGTCTINVKYKAIKCTLCETWYHSKCLNWSDTKFKKLTKIEIESWLCTNCVNITKTKKQIIQEKILHFDVTDNTDLESSFNLAIEAGSILAAENKELKQELNSVNMTLRTENETLKQKMHDMKIEKTKYHSELEDKLKFSEETLEKISGENKKLQTNVIHLNNKLTEEKNLKNELLYQAEARETDLINNNKQLYTINFKLNEQIMKLETNLVNKDTITDSLKDDNDILTRHNEELKKQLDSRNEMIYQMKHTYEDLLTKMTEQERAIQHFLKTFLGRAQNHLTQGSFIVSDDDQDQMEHKIKTMREDHLNNHDTQVKSKNLNNNITTPLTREQNLIPVKSHRKTLNGSVDSNRRKNIFSISLQVAKHTEFTKKKDGENIKGKLSLVKKPPQYARIRHQNEEPEDFFNKHINYYKNIHNQLSDNSPRSINKKLKKTQSSFLGVLSKPLQSI